jgi:hypothetical protein
MRCAFAVPVVATLSLLSVTALSFLVADEAALVASREMRTWGASRARPHIETWTSVRDRLVAAERLSPADPHIQELFGALNFSRTNEEEYLAQAAVHFSRAALLRPVSPYTWADIAEVNYKMGRTGREFLAALRHAIELGPNEPEVQRTAADYGLALWQEIGKEDRQAIDRMVAAGVSRNPLEMLQISQRRGRLAIACRHLVGISRAPDPKWYQICQRTEATP